MAVFQTPHQSCSISSCLLPLLFLTITLISYYTNAQSTNPTPSPVWVPGSTRTPTRLFILSGGIAPPTQNPYLTTPQFFYLDLSLPWSTTSPAWVQLRSGPESITFPGATSADWKKLFFFGIPGSYPVYQFSLETGNWSPHTQTSFAAGTEPGIGAVTDPNTDLVYLAGGYTDKDHGLLDVWDWKTGNVTNSALPDPVATGVFADRTFYTSGWCKLRGSVLFFGGYSRVTRSNSVSELKPPNSWSTLSTSGPAPANRADHCMAINDDGTKLIVYGGRLESNAFTSELFILTIATGTWAVGASSPLPRIYSACTIAGDQLIVWGGLTTLTQMAPKEVMIYDMKSNTWVEQYTPTGPYVNQTVPPIPGAVEAKPSTNATLSAVSPPGSTGTEAASSGGDSVIGIIAGSVLGVLGMCFIIFVVYQQRQRQGEQDIGTGGKEDGATDTREPQAIITAGPGINAATASATALYSQNPQGSVYGSAGGYQDPQSPHGVQVADDIQVRLREFKQMELREQLLILEEQAQAFQPGSQYQQQQHQQQQYQQQVPVQYPVTMGVSHYPGTVGTVQALPVTNSTVMEQYYPAAFIGEL